MNCKVFYHDKCFDGACSAALFTRFHRECIGTASSFDYRGLVHRAGALFEEGWFDSEGENAIVDFKYDSSPRLTWWFDHHQSAFLDAEDEALFRRGQTEADGTPGPLSRRQFFDPTYISCTGWIAHIASTRFGMNVEPLQDLIYWANIVDGAKYESARSAVEMAAPAMKLTLLIENAPDGPLVQQIIPLLTAMPLEEVLLQPFLQERLGPLLQAHRRGIELLRERVVCNDGVLTFDITDQPTEGYNKFIPYFLDPDAVYHVGLSKSSFRNKVSVGTNPWTTVPTDRLANIAALCERWGGGGHARVGAISFPVDAAEQARAAAVTIAAELKAAGAGLGDAGTGNSDALRE